MTTASPPTIPNAPDRAPGSYYRARYYDAPAGRFISEDFLRIPDGFSRYDYTLNSPVNYFDSLGLCPWEIRTRPLKLPKGLNDPANKLTPSDNPPTHNYFHNAVTGQTVGFGPLHDNLGNAIFGPGAWLPPEQPGKTKDDKPLGAVPDDICDCVDKKLKNPGAPPNYCLTGKIPYLPCTNCWNWDLKILTDCKNQKNK